MTDAEKYAKVKEIFQEAVDLPKEERQAFVKENSNGDAEIESEVLALLANHSEDTLLGSEEPLSETRASTTRKSIGPRASHTLMSYKKNGWLERLFGTKQRFAVLLGAAFILLIVLGVWSHNQVKSSLEDIRAEQLKTVIKANVQSLEFWIDDYQNSVQSWSSTPEIADEIHAILEYGNCRTCIEELQFSHWQDTLTGILKQYLRNTRSAGYNLYDPEGYEVAANNRKAIGHRLLPEVFRGLVQPHNDGGSFRSPMLPSEIQYENSRTSSIYEKPFVWAGNPIYNDSLGLIAYFGVGRYVDEAFSDRLSIYPGETGETYAFNGEGKMISKSRFLEQIGEIGLIDLIEESSTAMTLELRDPGVNMVEGETPKEPLGTRAFTKPVGLAINSQSDSSIARAGIIIEPFLDYRGIEVIGAYYWFPEYNFGIVTKQEYAEAFAPLKYIDFTFLLLIVLLALMIAYSLYSSLKFLGLKRKVGEAVQLGQYTLERKIGEGGIGQVYLANHALLKRPTAIKILKEDLVSNEVIERFEREVQLASRLTHPNTIEIYDFGRTEEGVFYYAMEVLNGFTLAQLVQMQGEVPVARVLHILKQATASIAEAHSIGLIHRDIKPQNIMLVQRGGEHDVVKVLDFGLVKDLTDEEAHQTKVSQLTGTPLYMAPERIKSPTHSDLRSDLYALGAVAYYLLAGEALFRFSTEIDIIYQVVNTDPEPLHKVNKKVPKAVSDFIHSLLDKEPDNRPQTAKEMIKKWDELMAKHPWTEEDAEKWWARFN